jgi:hypothetical protein
MFHLGLVRKHNWSRARSQAWTNNFSLKILEKQLKYWDWHPTEILFWQKMSSVLLTYTKSSLKEKKITVLWLVMADTQSSYPCINNSISLTVSLGVKVKSAGPQYGDLNSLFLYDKGDINICYVNSNLMATNTFKLTWTIYTYHIRLIHINAFIKYLLNEW